MGRISNIMKTKHDTVKNSISNVRSPGKALDDDSDGVVDETPGDLDGDGYSTPVDSDDSDPNINPGATEVSGPDVAASEVKTAPKGKVTPTLSSEQARTRRAPDQSFGR